MIGLLISLKFGKLFEMGGFFRYSRFLIASIALLAFKVIVVVVVGVAPNSLSLFSDNPL